VQKGILISIKNLCTCTIYQHIATGISQVSEKREKGEKKKK
jgi:aerobic-type carbon monoxide dehydrogenase small subunit (CoxS/CutS family)